LSTKWLTLKIGTLADPNTAIALEFNQPINAKELLFNFVHVSSDKLGAVLKGGNAREKRDEEENFEGRREEGGGRKVLLEEKNREGGRRRKN
jgi:hypothetical protein